MEGDSAVKRDEAPAEVPRTLNFENFALRKGRLLLRESIYMKYPE